MDIYEHVRTYWDVIDLNSLKNFIQITEVRDKEYKHLLADCDNDTQTKEILKDFIPGYKANVELRKKAMEKINNLREEL